MTMNPNRKEHECRYTKLLTSGLFWKLLLGSVLHTPVAFAQITPDGTLGSERSVVAPSVNATQDVIEQIEGGATRGSFLFHSFADFNISENQLVYFANPTGIDRILSRVTGTNDSKILGTLGVRGQADLFLLNPNGIIFGPNARLDIPGSFLVSTADSFSLGDTAEFSATEPQAPPLLIVDVPIGLQYEAAIPSDITNAGALQVGKNLVVSGGNIVSTGQLLSPNGQAQIDGVAGNVQIQALASNTAVLSATGQLTLEESQLQTQEDMTLLADTIRVRDSAEVPFIATAGGNLQIRGNRTVDIFALNHAASGLASGGNMLLQAPEQVGGDAYYFAGGSFRVEDLNGNPGNLFSPYDPIIRSVGDVTLSNYTGTSLHILSGGTVNIGQVVILGPDLGGIPDRDFLQGSVNLSNGDSIPINGGSQATLDIRAGMDANAVLQSGPIGTTGFDRPIDGGFDNGLFGQPAPQPDNTVVIDNKLIFGIAPTPSEPGFIPRNADINIGGVTIAQDNGLVFMTSQYMQNDGLAGGDINISGDVITGSAAGNGGAVVLDARKDININDSDILTSSNTANAGNISLLAQENISVERGLIASTGVAGGDILFTSELGNVALNDSIVASYTTGTDTAGDVVLDANSIFLDNAAAVVNATEGLTPGGDIRLQANDLLQITDRGTARTVSSPAIARADLVPGTGITANTLTGPAPGGNISIEAGQIKVQNLAPVTSENFAGITTTAIAGSVGNSGNISVTADSVELIGNDPTPYNPTRDGLGVSNIIQIPTGITSSTNGTGQAGKVEVNTNRLIIEDRAGLTAGNSPVSRLGAGNDVTINATDSIELTNLAVIASGTVGAGQSGNVTINSPAGRLTMQDGAIIGADTAGSGNAGTVTVNVEQIDVLSGSRIGASTLSNGNAGGLVIPNASRILVDGFSADGSVPSSLFFSATGGARFDADAGNLELNTQELIVQNGGEIAGDTEGRGRGGLLSLNTDSLQVRGPDSRISFESRGAGNAQGIEINAGQLVVENQGVISVSGDGTGTSGDLNITAGSILLNQQGQLTAETRASQGGNITLRVPGSIVMQNDGNPTEATEISARAFGTANGGNITFEVDGFILAVLEENSDVLAAAEAGEGGAITATARGIFGFREFQGQVTPESDFTATAALPLGVDGTVDVQTQEPPDPEPLPDDFAGNDIAQGCIASAVQANSSESQSSLQVTGLGGLPSQPITAQNTAALIIELVDPVRESEEATESDLITQSQPHDNSTHLFVSTACTSQ